MLKGQVGYKLNMSQKSEAANKKLKESLCTESRVYMELMVPIYSELLTSPFNIIFSLETHILRWMLINYKMSKGHYLIIRFRTGDVYLE